MHYEWPRVVFDLDGVLANTSHRDRFIDQHPKDWDSYFDHMAGDTPIEVLLELYDTYYYDAYDMVICTGRPERYRGVTLDWLASVGVPNTSFLELFMRGDDDRRTNAEYKLSCLEELGPEKIHVWVEDNPKAAMVLRSKGVKTLLVHSNQVAAERSPEGV